MSSLNLPVLGNAGQQLLTADDSATASTAAMRDPSGDLYAKDFRASAGIRNTGHTYQTTVAKSATFTIDESSNNGTVYVVDASGGAVTVNLPAAASSSGKVVTVIRTSASNNVTLDGNASETINGATTLVLSSQYAKATLVCDGTTWWQIG